MPLLRVLLASVFVVVLCSCESAESAAAPATLLPAGLEPDAPTSFRRVEFQTEDRVTLVGDLYGTDTQAPIVICLPMYRNVRSTWNPLVPSLRELGLNVLTLDLRGHGESGKEFIDPVKARDAEVFKVMWRDVEAARKFLEGRGYDITRIGLCGASVGCSVALSTVARNPGPYRAVVLMTPGAKYLGVDSLLDAEKWQGTPLLLLTSEEEKPGVAPVAAAFESWGERCTLEVYPETKIHGTRMFGKVSGVEKRIATFLSSRLSQLQVPQFAADDPRVKTAGFFTRTARTSRQGLGGEYRLMSYAVGDTVTLGAMFKGDMFRGTACFFVGAATIEFPFDTQKRSMTPIPANLECASFEPREGPL